MGINFLVAHSPGMWDVIPLSWHNRQLLFCNYFFGDRTLKSGIPVEQLVVITSGFA